MEYTENSTRLTSDLVAHVAPHRLLIIAGGEAHVVVLEENRHDEAEPGDGQVLAQAIPGAGGEGRKGPLVEDELRPRVPPLRDEVVRLHPHRFHCWVDTCQQRRVYAATMATWRTLVPRTCPHGSARP